MEFNELFEVVCANLPSSNPVYLVGGAVRDKLLGRAIHDLDFGLFSGTKKTAQTVARYLKSPFFMLDEKRLAARVIFRPNASEEYLLDFVTLVGSDITTDLKARDFTINAMAIDTRSPAQLIDPCGGQEDLRSGILRACSTGAMKSDPLRILRGVRLASNLKMVISAETEVSMRSAAALISGVSAERLRDELFKILEGINPHSAIEKLDSLNALQIILPELEKLKGIRQSEPHMNEVWTHTLRTLYYLDKIMQAFVVGKSSDGEGYDQISDVIRELQPFHNKIHEHLNGFLVPGRTRRSLISLAALLHDNAKPQTWSIDQQGRIHNYDHERIGSDVAIKRARQLALSNAEADYIGKIVAHHMRVHSLAKTKMIPTRRATYRFFRDSGEAGVDVCLLSLADTLATYENKLPSRLWLAELDITRIFLHAWWHNHEQSINPPRLLTGNDLKNLLNLEQGKIIGQLLSSVYEAQISGEVTNRDEALAYASEKLRLLED